MLSACLKARENATGDAEYCETYLNGSVRASPNYSALVSATKGGILCVQILQTFIRFRTVVSGSL